MFFSQAVAAHEKQMREQAKKMNVASLRSSEAANTSAECKLAKVLYILLSRSPQNYFFILGLNLKLLIN